MDNRAVVERIMKNLAFDLETVPKTKSVPGSSTTPSKIDPLNVKIRVRKKETVTEPYNQGFISNNQSEPEMVLQKVRLVNSDETIMSFDMFMEAESDKKTTRKPRKHIFDKLRPGLCLGATDDDDHPYMPKTGKTFESSSASKSYEILRQPFTISKNAYDSFGDRNITRRERTFLGKKCKPGGCLDPPFGEDKYSYKPCVQEPIIDESKNIPKVKTGKIDTDIITAVRAPERKKKSKDISIKSLDAKVKESDSISSIHKKDSPTNSVITYPPENKIKTIKTRVPSEDDRNKTRKSKPSSEDKSRQSVNESMNSFFSPPKGMKRDSSNYSQRDSSTGHSYSPKSINNKPVEYLIPPVPDSASLDSVTLDRTASPEIIEDIEQKDNKLSEEPIKQAPDSGNIKQKHNAPFILPVPLPVPIPFSFKFNRTDKKGTSEVDIDSMDAPITHDKTNPIESVKIVNESSPTVDPIPFKNDSTTMPGFEKKTDIIKSFDKKLDEVAKPITEWIGKSPPLIYQTSSNESSHKVLSKAYSENEKNYQLLKPVNKEQNAKEQTNESNEGITHDIVESPSLLSNTVEPESTRSSLEPRISQAINQNNNISLTEVTKENYLDVVDEPCEVQSEGQNPDVAKPNNSEGENLINSPDIIGISADKDISIANNIDLNPAKQYKINNVFKNSDEPPEPLVIKPSIKDEIKKVVAKSDEIPKLLEVKSPSNKDEIKRVLEKSDETPKLLEIEPANRDEIIKLLEESGETSKLLEIKPSTKDEIKEVLEKSDEVHELLEIKPSNKYEIKKVVEKSDKTPKLLEKIKPSIMSKHDLVENKEKSNITLQKTQDLSPKIHNNKFSDDQKRRNKNSIEQQFETKYVGNPKTTAALPQQQKSENLPEEKSLIKEISDQALKGDSILSELNSPTNNFNKKTNRKSGDGDNHTRKALKENRENINTPVENTHYSRPFSPSSSEKSSKGKKKKSPDRRPVYPLDIRIKDPKMTTKKTERKSDISSSIKKKKLPSPDIVADISTVTLDLAFHSYENSRNERILSTFDAKNKIKRYPNDAIILIKSQVRLPPQENNYELSIPIDSKFDMVIEITKTIERSIVIPDETEIKPNTILVQPDAKTQNIMNGSRQKTHLKNKESDKACSTLMNIYEQELVPLQAMIRDLKLEIDMLAAKQTVFKEKVFCPRKTETPRLIHSNKRCSP